MKSNALHAVKAFWTMTKCFKIRKGVNRMRISFDDDDMDFDDNGDNGDDE